MIYNFYLIWFSQHSWVFFDRNCLNPHLKLISPTVAKRGTYAKEFSTVAGKSATDHSNHLLKADIKCKFPDRSLPQSYALYLCLRQKAGETHAHQHSRGPQTTSVKRGTQTRKDGADALFRTCAKRAFNVLGANKTLKGSFVGTHTLPHI